MGYKSRGNHPTYTHHNQNPKKGDWHEIFQDKEEADEESKVREERTRHDSDEDL